VTTSLGPLSDLAGTWVGWGFNLIAVPDAQGGAPFRLLLAATREVLTFEPIDSPIVNRGSAQDDISFRGVQYRQQINDRFSNQTLHLETGVWLHTPDTSAPPARDAVARLGTVPHGTSFLAQGTHFTDRGPPEIGSIRTTPTGPSVTPDYLRPYAEATPPPGIPRAAVADPNVVLSGALDRASVLRTTTLEIATTPGGASNIPFLVRNADATRVSATTWIETVRLPAGREGLQLQYSQTVILRFAEIDWPHVTVATLTKR
jgi:hypothetical protein